MIIPIYVNDSLNYHVNELKGLFLLSDTNILLLFELCKYYAKKIAQKSKILFKAENFITI